MREDYLIKIPKTLKVGGRIYKIKFPYVFRERVDQVAACHHALGEIVISDKDQAGGLLDRQEIEESFIHELLHCVDLVYNAQALEEATICRLSEGLYQVIKDNKLVH